MAAGGGPTAVADRLVREREGEERKTEGTEKEERPRVDSSLRQSQNMIKNVKIEKKSPSASLKVT
jgi:hypothetical protein